MIGQEPRILGRIDEHEFVVARDFFLEVGPFQHIRREMFASDTQIARAKGHKDAFAVRLRLGERIIEIVGKAFGRGGAAP